MQITILGSGNSAPTHRRSCAGVLVEWSGGAVLLDASAGTYQRALKAGLQPPALRAVALSHFHPDHTADLPALLAARLHQGLTNPIAIAGPPGTAALVDRFRAVYESGWLDSPYEVAPYPFEVAGMRIDAFPARHSPEAHALRLAADGKTVGYSGDSADCEGLRSALRGVDVALLECTGPDPSDVHLCPADCAAVVADCRPGRTLLTHLPATIASDFERAEDGLVVAI